MIAVGIRYLCGYAAATDLSRQRPEWPVHPGRVFLAMAAAHYETGSDRTERNALVWLEAAGSPEIQAGRGEARSYVKAYVPVNDDHGSIAQRSRQERAFPKAWLEDDSVYLVWRSDPPQAVLSALTQLCPKVTRIGHSSSLVQMWVVKGGEEPTPNWTLSDSGEERMRVSSAGTMAMLDAAFNADGLRGFEELESRMRAAEGQAKIALRHQLEEQFPDGQPPYWRPELAVWQGYEQRGPGEVVSPPAEGPFDSNILILTKFEGRNLGLDATLALTRALRNAAMKAATNDQVRPAEWLSGHSTDESPSLKPHTAFFTLPFVDAENADGHVMGLALALPKEINPVIGKSREETIRQALGPLLFDLGTGEERGIRLWCEKANSAPEEYLWEWELRRENRERPPQALRAETWTKASRVWASVTPVVLHHYPRKSRVEDVERIIRQAFTSAFLPEPMEVLIRSASALCGAGHARAMPTLDEGGAGLCQYQTHVIVRFPGKVRGPVLVGRGRYRGYGLFKPIDERDGRSDAN
jgi:CRISPR-associated protein Csb2